MSIRMPGSAHGRIEQTMRVVSCASMDAVRLRAQITVQFNGARTVLEADESAEEIVSALVEVLQELPASACLDSEPAVIRRVMRQVPPAGVVRQVDLLLEPSLASSGTRRKPPKVPAERGRVLVVDDDPNQRTTLEALLADEFEVTTVASAADAERLLAGARFEVLLTDYDMPDGTGTQLLRRIERSSPSMIGMLLTAHDEFPDVLAAKRDRRIFRVLLKPYDPQMLVGCVRSGVALARMREAAPRVGRRG
jgi:CheY-like chemotaxis protein